VFRRLKLGIIQHIRENITFYLIIIFALLTGITTGFFTAGAMDSTQRSALGDYLNSFFQGTKYDPINRNAVFAESIWQHTQSTFMIWLSGVFLFGMPLIILFVGIRSFFIGFTTGFLLSQYHFGGFLFILVCIMPQTLIYIPCIIGVGVLALEYSIDRLKNRKIYHNKEQQKRKLGEYTIKILVLFMLMAVGSLVEAYISPVFFSWFRWVFD
jgi:stage II sporulation protein M